LKIAPPPPPPPPPPGLWPSSPLDKIILERALGHRERAVVDDGAAAAIEIIKEIGAGDAVESVMPETSRSYH